MIRIASLLQAVSEADRRYTKSEKEHVVIGKSDKKIGIMSPDGDLTVLNPKLTILPTGNGELKIPTDLGGLELKWGKQTVQANSAQNYPFPIPFTSRCLIIVGSQELNDPLTNIMIQAVSKDEFKVSVVGGSGSEVVSWIAIGD